MEYFTIDGFEKKLSRIIFGCADMSEGKDASLLLDEALALGINTFDTARVYGKSEKSLGTWLKSQNREDIVIITKGCHPSFLGRKRVTRNDFLKDLKLSLNALGTNYIDIYLLHRDNELVPVGEIIEMLNECHERGLIRAFGVSNWSFERIVEANEYAKAHNLMPFMFSSPHYSLAEQIHSPWGNDCVSLTGKDSAKAREWYRKSKFPVLAYSALAHGFLSGKCESGHLDSLKNIDYFAKKGYLSEENIKRLSRVEQLAKKKNCSVSQLSLAWLFTQGLNVFAITSVSSPIRLRENCGALDIHITHEEAAWLNLEN